MQAEREILFENLINKKKQNIKRMDEFMSGVHGRKEPQTVKNIRKKVGFKLKSKANVEKIIKANQIETFGFKDSTLDKQLVDVHGPVEADKIREVIFDEVVEKDKYYSELYLQRQDVNAETNDEPDSLVMSFKNDLNLIADKKEIFELAMMKIPDKPELGMFRLFLRHEHFDFWGFARHLNLLTPKEKRTHEISDIDFENLIKTTSIKPADYIKRMKLYIEGKDFLQFDSFIYFADPIMMHENFKGFYIKMQESKDEQVLKFAKLTTYSKKAREIKDTDEAVSRGLENYILIHNEGKDERDKIKTHEAAFELYLLESYEKGEGKKMTLDEFKTSVTSHVQIPNSKNDDKIKAINKKTMDDMAIATPAETAISSIVSTDTKVEINGVEKSAFKHWMEYIWEDGDFELNLLEKYDTSYEIVKVAMSVSGEIIKRNAASVATVGAAVVTGGATVVVGAVAAPVTAALASSSVAAGAAISSAWGMLPSFKQAEQMNNLAYGGAQIPPTPEQIRYVNKQRLLNKDLTVKILTAIFKLMKIMWSLLNFSVFLIPKLVNFLYNHVWSSAEHYIGKALEKIWFSPETAKSFAYYIAGFISYTLIIATIVITAVASIWAVWHVLSFAIVSAMGGPLMPTISAGLQQMMTAEQLIFGSTTFSGLAYGAFSMTKGAAKQYQTGYKDEYDDRCKDMNSDFYKQNAWCAQYKQEDIKRFDDDLKEEIAARGDLEKESLLAKKRYRTTDAQIFDPRGETTPGVGSYCNESCELGKKFTVKIYGDYFSQSVNTLNVNPSTADIELVQNKYKEWSKKYNTNNLNILTWVWELLVFVTNGLAKRQIDLTVDYVNDHIMKYIPNHVLLNMLILADRDLNSKYYHDTADWNTRVEKDVTLKLSNFLSLVLTKYSNNTQHKVAEAANYVLLTETAVLKNKLESDTKMVILFDRINDTNNEKQLTSEESLQINQFFQAGEPSSKPFSNFFSLIGPELYYQVNQTISNKGIKQTTDLYFLKFWHGLKDMESDNKLIRTITYMKDRESELGLNINYNTTKIKNSGETNRTQNTLAKKRYSIKIIKYASNLEELFIHYFNLEMIRQTGVCRDEDKKNQAGGYMNYLASYVTSNACKYLPLQKFNELVKELGQDFSELTTSVSTLYINENPVNFPVLQTFSYLVPRDEYSNTLNFGNFDLDSYKKNVHSFIQLLIAGKDEGLKNLTSNGKIKNQSGTLDMLKLIVLFQGIPNSNPPDLKFTLFGMQTPLAKGVTFDTYFEKMLPGLGMNEGEGIDDELVKMVFAAPNAIYLHPKKGGK